MSRVDKNSSVSQLTAILSSTKSLKTHSKVSSRNDEEVSDLFQSEKQMLRQDIKYLIRNLNLNNNKEALKARKVFISEAVRWQFSRLNEPETVIRGRIDSLAQKIESHTNARDMITRMLAQLKSE